MTAQRVLSGMRPTGMLHLGNYFGALEQFVQLQNKTTDQRFFFVADLHRLTTHQKRDNLNQASIDIVKGYLACGLDPDKSTIYKQSEVAAIPYLATILGMLVSESWLRKCTTYKDKLATGNIPSLGLLGYPVLMAADILVLQADLVPVGHDQLQHLEMARDIAAKFNHHYGPTFKLPAAIKLKAIRIPGLDGKGKMSKSEQNYIGLFEEPKSIQKKVMSALTDSGTEGSNMPPSIKNIYYLLELCAPPAVYSHYRQLFAEKSEKKFYGALKKDLAHHIIELLAPFRAKYQQIKDQQVEEILTSGAKKVQPLANNTLDQVLTRLKL